MKPFLVMLMLTASLTVNAQYVNGVQITGHVSSIVEKFKAKGWKYLETVDGVVRMRGTFAGYYDCNVFIYSTNAKQVARVGIFLPEQHSWNSLYDRYNSLVNIYSNKFGRPDESKLTFEYPYELGDGFEEMAVKNEKTDISSTWVQRDNGSYRIFICEYMEISIICDNVINMRIRHKERENSLFN